MMNTAVSIPIIQSDDLFVGCDLSQAVAGGNGVILLADLSRMIEYYDCDGSGLSPEERQRADAYIRPEDRRMFIRRRTFLRRLLGKILNREPGDILIQTDKFGKPILNPKGLPWPTSFSISHSQERVIYAFIRETQIGIDLEYCDPAVEVKNLAKIMCTSAERKRLEAMSVSEQIRAFYDCWCAKEAWIKAAGVCEPTSFEVSFWPEDAGLVRNAQNPATQKQWSFHRLDVGSNWSAMVVVEGNSKLIFFRNIKDNQRSD